MAENVAARELEALGNAMRVGQQTDDAATALDRITPERDERPAVGEDGEAQFGTPEAIATAVVGSVLLGPVGGLLLGGAQGWLSKRAQQDILDELVAENEGLQGAADVYAGTFDALRKNIVTPEEHDQINLLETEYKAATEMMFSGSAANREKGAVMFTNFQTRLSQFADLQDQQRIALDAAEAQLKAQMGERAYTEHKSLHGNYMTRTDPLVEQQRVINVARTGINRGDGPGVFAGQVGLIKLQNPGSVDLPESMIAMMDTLNGLADSLEATVAKNVSDGGGWTDETRRDALKLLDDMERFNRAAYENVNYDTRKLLELSPVTPQYWPTYSRDNAMQSVNPAFTTRGFDTDEDAEHDKGLIDAASEVAGDIREMAPVQTAIDTIKDMGEGYNERLRDRGRRARERVDRRRRARPTNGGQ